MTLLELVVALLLASLLFTAIVGVVRTVARQTVHVERRVDADWQAAFLNILQRDLMASDSLFAREGNVYITGLLPCYDTATSSATHRTVVYACITDGRQTVLSRCDRGRSGHFAFAQFGLSMERIDDDGHPQPLPKTPGPVPKRVRVWIKDQTTVRRLLGDLVL